MQFIATATLLAAAVLNILNVAGRYFFSAPIEWAEEVMLFMMVAVVFLAAVAVARTGSHIRMDVAMNLLPALQRRVVEVFCELVEIAVALAVTVLGVPLVVQLYEFDQRSQAAQFPLWIPQALIPLGFALIAVVTALKLFKNLNQTPRSPSAHDPLNRGSANSAQ